MSADGMQTPRYARAAKRDPGACPECAPGVQCVACRFAGRPAPRLRKYLGRLAVTLTRPGRDTRRDPDEPEPAE